MGITSAQAGDSKLNNQWIQYQNKYYYASDICYNDTILSIKDLILYL